MWATLHVTWLSLACLVLVLWVNQRTFTGLANLVVAGLSWGLIKGATLARHPFDPLGSSNVVLYQTLYLAMVAVLFVAGWQFAHWLQKQSTAAFGQPILRQCGKPQPDNNNRFVDFSKAFYNGCSEISSILKFCTRINRIHTDF